MLEQQEGTDGVCRKGFVHLGGVELGGGLFGVEDAWDGEGEVEM